MRILIATAEDENTIPQPPLSALVSLRKARELYRFASSMLVRFENDAYTERMRLLNQSIKLEAQAFEKLMPMLRIIARIAVDDEFVEHEGHLVLNDFSGTRISLLEERGFVKTIQDAMDESFHPTRITCYLHPFGWLVAVHAEGRVILTYQLRP